MQFKISGIYMFMLTLLALVSHILFFFKCKVEYFYFPLQSKGLVIS